ncbi:hypothetical protein A8C56_16170 [Niabella ginsenosidivorans]|uniref:DUF1440 domain-containing protein n=1 Tax=Niabella ginsenosidivorans TaxID=1176587 RepID=A0A1A9I5F6_9BACT|nr:hypothetical protein [Niabella ginsenosidivorans]ANH82289.1 hypothetical protein A8C56_16170 [Niabella ginsenosidivorans]
MKRLSSVIVKTGLLAGTLDLSAAFLYFYIATGKNPLFILQYISSAVMGQKALESQWGHYLVGFILHYCVAFAFTILFFKVYPRIRFFQKNLLLTAILYGAFVWCVMNLLVVPASRIGRFPGSASGIIINMIILMICIGLPLSFSAAAFFSKKNGHSS